VVYRCRRLPAHGIELRGPVFVRYILQHFSCKTGFLFIGFSLLIPGILIAQLLMRRTVPEAYDLKPDGQSPAEDQRLAVGHPAAPPAPASAKDIRTDSRFWILALCHGTAVMTAFMAFVHQVPYAIDNGIAKVAAATSLGAMGFAVLLGQFFLGWILSFRMVAQPGVAGCRDRRHRVVETPSGQRLTIVRAACKN